MKTKSVDKDVLNVMKLKLRYLAKRCETLAERLEEVKELGTADDYSGYKEGCDSPMWTLDEYLGGYADILYAIVAEKYGKDTNEYDIGYHMENVNHVIHEYFLRVVNDDVKPDNEVLDLDIEETRITKDTLLKIADEI